MIRELDRVVLTADLSEMALNTGDPGTVVPVHASGRDHQVESVALDGHTIGVATVPADQRRPIHPNEIANARAVAPYWLAPTQGDNPYSR